MLRTPAFVCFRGPSDVLPPGMIGGDVGLAACAFAGEVMPNGIIAAIAAAPPTRKRRRRSICSVIPGVFILGSSSRQRRANLGYAVLRAPEVRVVADARKNREFALVLSANSRPIAF